MICHPTGMIGQWRSPITSLACCPVSETVKVKECRIIYRRAGSAQPKGYAAAATVTPTL
jgi:hypothetical protein